MKEEVENDDLVFDALLKDRRDKEMMELLKGIKSVIGKPNNSEQVLKAIGGNSEDIKSLVKTISNLKFPDFPEIKIPSQSVTVNNDKVAHMIGELKEEMSNISQALEKQNDYLEELFRPKEWDFEVYKDSMGRLKGVKATQIKQKISNYSFKGIA